MSDNPSLQKHLAVGLALLLVLVMACQWGAVSWTIRRVTQEYIASRLAHDAENLLANLDIPLDGLPISEPVRLDPIYTQPWSGHYYQIQIGETILRSRSLWDAELSVPGEAVVMISGPRDQTILVFTRTYNKQKKSIRISVAEEMTNILYGVAVLQGLYALISLVAIVLLLIMQRSLVRHVLQPLDTAQEEVRRLELGEVGALSTGLVPKEIVPFVTAINRLLLIMTERLERSRHVAGNMAHAIKTPLTVLLQLAESREFEARPELRERLAKQIHLIRTLTGRELKKVRMAGSSAPALRVDISGELLMLVEVMQRVHKARGLRFEVHLPKEMSALVDREDLLELSGNLLDNACKWANGVVRMTVMSDTQWHLMVEDDGPGCADEFHPQILQRGGRADGNMQGHGIGLAVVKEIVADYGGRLELGTSEELGGFRVAVGLPLRGVIEKMD
ncbi:MAG: GHKL domain-containing protein [Magnetococcales bacterium]|nr:GHKL domain-containing protein [Magnetococcales bacterium]